MPIDKDTTYNINFESIHRGQGQGNTRASISNVIRSKNWLGGPAALPKANDGSGLVFISKPDYNLTSGNVAHRREYAHLLTSDPRSLGASIRDMLDPRTANGNLSPGDQQQRHSLLNDPLYPFMGLLDNTLSTLDGWPDYVTDEFTSTPGRAGSTYITARGRIAKGQKFTLTATHRNLPGDAINHIYTSMQHYMEHVHNWEVGPHFINIAKDRLDYVSRIYRFVFDSTGTKVTQFTMCGYGFPKAGSQGAVMNYDANKAVNEGYDEISAAWTCVGVFHNDPIVIDEFNRVVRRFNPSMHDSRRESRFVKVTLDKVVDFQYHGYPRINPRTLEFEIWVPNAIHEYLSQDIAGKGVEEIRRNIALQKMDEGIENMSDEDKELILAKSKDT